MMKKIKGCVNESCEAHIKKLKFKESEIFCSKCGSPLFHVCKDCFFPLPEVNDKYCVRCHAKHEDTKVKAGKVKAGVGATIASVVALALGKKFGNSVLDKIITIGIKAFGLVKNIKG
ncbi:MAG TPA: hypothetical protein PLH64_02055 [Anaerolineaceae bacterium]|nr:hypothetical protein [Anaerolineaceae bacterium]